MVGNVKKLLFIAGLFLLVGCPQNNLTHEVPEDENFVVTAAEPRTAKEGDLLTITGEGFTQDAFVTVNGATVSHELISETEIKISVPETDAGAAAVEVTQYGRSQYALFYSLKTNATAKKPSEEVIDPENKKKPSKPKDELYPIIIGDQGTVCDNQPYYDEFGELKTGTLKCNNTLPNCSELGETECVATDEFKAVPADEIGKITAPAIRSCAQDGDKDCLANAAFPAVDTSTLAPKVLVGTSVAGVAGTLQFDLPDASNVRVNDTTGGVPGTLADCSSDGQVGCVATATYLK